MPGVKLSRHRHCDELLSAEGFFEAGDVFAAFWDFQRGALQVGADGLESSAQALR